MKDRPRRFSLLPSKEEDKGEEPEGKPGHLNDEERQTIYGLLHQGQSQRFILGIYGAEKNDKVAKMAEEMELGKAAEKMKEQQEATQMFIDMVKKK